MSPLQSAMDQLDRHDRVSLPGSRSVPAERWARHRRVLYGACLGVLGLGVLCLVAGILLRDTGVWALLVPVGFVLLFTATISVGAAALNSHLMRDRLSAETEPVVLDATGVILRGIGPVPWEDLGPPERRLVRVRNDIGGQCAVMPLNVQGQSRVNQQPARTQHRFGPRPYLRLDVPYLLLPGIDDLTEDETMRLFQIAQQRFLSRRQPPG